MAASMASFATGAGVGTENAMLAELSRDYSRPFLASNHAAWEEEYRATVQGSKPPQQMIGGGDLWDDDWFSSWGQVFPGEEAGFTDAREVHHAD
jgi:hypothetical protein